MAVSIGRLRPDTQYDYKFVCLSHNTLRGAAGGAVLLAELLCAEGYIIEIRESDFLMHRRLFLPAPVSPSSPPSPMTTVAIDYEFGQLIERQIAGGTDAICVCGTTGESATMSIRKSTSPPWNSASSRSTGRVKVIAGAGSNDTSAAVYLSQHAQDSGADALLHGDPLL